MKQAFLYLIITLIAVCHFAVALHAESATTDPKVLIEDNFSDADYAPRKLPKGNWEITDGVASAQHGPEPDGKMKKHGPQVAYATDFTDGTVSFDVKCSKCKAFTVAVDSAKPDKVYHIRLKLKGKNDVGQAALINTFEPKAEGARKAVSISLLEEGIPELNEGEWNHVEIKFDGNQATSTVNGKSNAISHDRIALLKRVIKIELQTGEFSIRNFSLTVPN
ncbi:protein of unknown function [Neorhodopirellula lusitana]|uniref:3-keto-alpha-glucoside-1,2-lyase/3-keto-2-hydroxy-glucal hydratase domain-containing protein n=1 Tax=Neorhodopirellula lusitana TaxID=445327 RepID=A0ABY1QE70_9BACT|nr:family 16 glycoside hydrolase [Neorhodopirellula lusitana]SMP68974.1 protein of unknown function [Neorhodopirellula lusitana]